ncbi:cell envelope integrity EipB family protein [Rhizobiaceae bacterium n13]|uniref:Cell envelope integrity EipB family protein n=1 Tax=Ferirhizobium litorale TaxID=2927786 RepID=A0AAE3QID3_9HYPH|nr:cell envelope integrity EipB family protein [Fererhizobium litorale]MDI7864007.1 cell envelope integrity EipB family protein [Fererhizobium litorale]MDI7924510.1 cell envelope integrity EipB family protein [Fererhizobium litorale]
MFRSSFAAGLVSGAGAICLTTLAAQAAPASGLIPHRAVYDLELRDASERSGIAGMHGRMVYEFHGSSCAGYTTKFRFVTQIDTGEDRRTTDQQTTSFEDIKAGIFRFQTKSFTDEKLDKEVKGAAREVDDSVKVELSQPSKREVELASSRFPTEHMLEVIENAKKGTKLFESRIFDGSDNGDQTLLTTTFVGPKKAPASDDSESKQAGDFANASFWPVTIAYFNDVQDADSVPIYRMSFKLYENGITRDLTMDYGDFVLTGRLQKLEVLDDKGCK